MTLKIGTHSGSFHADESLACHLLLQTAKFKGSEIVRSRDPAVLATCDVVVDVGGIYDPSANRYDHHQREFQDTMTIGDTKYETRLSSAGLVYRHFGREAICNVAGVEDNQDNAELVNWMYKKLYEDLIEGFDGNDNGVNRYPKDIKPKYRDNTGIASRVSRLNPWWNETVDESGYMERFMKAVEICGKEFDDRVLFMSKSLYVGRQIVKKAHENRFSVEGSGRIILLEQFCPWKEYLLELEEELKCPEDQKCFYAIYPDSGGSWRVQAVPVDHGSFESRKPLPEPWRGVRDELLSEKIGIPGSIFVHASGFIGGNKTKEGALSMALASLKH